MLDHATLHAATAVAADLHEKLQAMRIEAVKSRSLELADLEDLLVAEGAAGRLVSRLLKLKQAVTNAEIA
jgi:hypothetical protein